MQIQYNTIYRIIYIYIYIFFSSFSGATSSFGVCACFRISDKTASMKMYLVHLVIGLKCMNDVESQYFLHGWISTNPRFGKCRDTVWIHQGWNMQMRRWTNRFCFLVASSTPSPMFSFQEMFRKTKKKTHGKSSHPVNWPLFQRRSVVAGLAELPLGVGCLKSLGFLHEVCVKVCLYIYICIYVDVCMCVYIYRSWISMCIYCVYVYPRVIIIVIKHP